MQLINKRITELQLEADKLVKQRDQLYKTISDIDVRLHQIIGAVDELNTLIKLEGARSEDDQTNKSSISKSINEIK
jgi:hypothetical protein